MSGRVIRILPITSYNFSDITAGASYIFTIADRIDVSQYRMATLMVRRHGGDVGGSAEVKVFARASGYTEQDPTNVFATSTDLASVSITGSISDPEYYTAELTAGDMGAMVIIGISVTQDQTAQSIDAKLSIDLSLKD